MKRFLRFPTETRLVFFLAVIAIFLPSGIRAQDWAGLNRYRPANIDLIKQNGVLQKPRIVFMGNSITENWVKFRPEYFTANGYTGRGISGQTTPQMLVRFRQDVVNIGAETVVILAGTNDLAGNTGLSSPEMVLDNIASMCDIARANGIRVILCSVLPAREYSWNKQARPDLLIPQLNALIREYAQKNGIPFADFFSALTDGRNGLPERLSKDGVHPNSDGYIIMERVLAPYLPPEGGLSR